MNDTFCNAPWISLNVDSQGHFRPCCKYISPISTSLYKYKHSNELQKLKNDFKNGVKNKNCVVCHEDEIASKTSQRQYINNLTTIKSKDISYLDITFGNKCNLACIMCSSHSSSNWYQYDRRNSKILPNIQVYKHNKFYKDGVFLKNITDILSNNLIRVAITGGEPFLADDKIHQDFLTQLLTYAPNVHLHYITNISVLPSNKILSLLAQFKLVEIQLSIDGTNDVYNYIRWPGIWENIYPNIKQYQEYTTLYANFNLCINYTVTIFNVLYIPEFTIWCLQHNLSKPILSLVGKSDIFNIRTLPESIKKRISIKFKGLFNDIVLYMNKINYNRNETIKYINILDKQRNLDFKKTFPDLTELLDYDNS